MSTGVSKEVFERLARAYAEKLSSTNAAGYTYNYDGGVQNGIETALIHVFGYKYDAKTDKDVSVSTRVKERAEQLATDWQADDERLNGIYVLNGNRVKIERSWNPDCREMLFWDSDNNKFAYSGSKTIKNETILDMVYNQLLTRYVEPELPLLNVDELTLPDAD